MTDPRPMTEAQRFVAKTLTSLLLEGGQYRVGALFLSYRSTEPGKNSQMAHGIAMREGTEECGRDLVDLVAVLRLAATQLEAKWELHVPTADSGPKKPLTLGQLARLCERHLYANPHDADKVVLATSGTGHVNGIDRVEDGHVYLGGA